MASKSVRPYRGDHRRSHVNYGLPMIHAELSNGDGIRVRMKRPGLDFFPSRWCSTAFAADGRLGDGDPVTDRHKGATA